jgi:predicted nucleotidyltransferase
LRIGSVDCSVFLLHMQYNSTAMISLRSNLRRRLLTFFYVNRSARAYVRQLAAALGADSTNVSRELARLEREGFLRAETEGRQLYYTINRDYPYLKPVFALLQGSVGIEPTLKHALQAVPGIESAWLYGSLAKNEADSASDIDLLLVGQPDQARLASEIRKAEQALRREINYTILTLRELKRRLRMRDAFLADIWNGKRIALIGHGHDQSATGKSEAGASVPDRRPEEGHRRAKNPQHRRGNRLPDGLPGDAQGIASADVEPWAASTRATRASHRNH